MLSFYDPNDSALKLGGHAMYIDTKFNSLLTALANVYMNLNVVAMKMHNYIGSMDSRPSEKLIKGSLFDLIANVGLIEEVFSLQYTLTRSHLKSWPGSACAVTEDHVRWYPFLDVPECRIGAKAFKTTLSAKQSGYKKILVWLDDIMESTKGGRLQRSMERIASRHSISKRMRY
jgi:hypothetical protein